MRLSLVVNGKTSTAVSIHASVWDATLKAAGFETNYYMFQSTHPHGMRLKGFFGTFDAE